MKPSFLVGIWGLLLVLLGISMALGFLGNVVLATTLIFAVATAKAFLVAAYYMRIRWEPRYIVGLLCFALFVVLILYFTLIPDIVHVYGG